MKPPTLINGKSDLSKASLTTSRSGLVIRPRGLITGPHPPELPIYPCSKASELRKHLQSRATEWMDLVEVDDFSTLVEIAMIKGRETVV